MIGYLIGVIGIGTGLAALIANIKALRAEHASHNSRRLRFLVVLASLLGLVACGLTSFLAFEAPTIEGPILEYGWPFMVRTTDHHEADNYLWQGLAFWLLAPQVLVYAYARSFRVPLAHA